MTCPPTTNGFDAAHVSKPLARPSNIAPAPVMTIGDRSGPGKRLLLLTAAVVVLGRSPLVSAQDATPPFVMDGWLMPSGLVAEPGFLRNKLVRA